MLNKLKISSRLVLLIVVQTIVLLAIGLTAIIGLHFAAKTTDTLNESVIEQVKLNQLNETVRVDILGMVQDMNGGKISWAEGRARLLSARNLFVNNWDEYKEDRTPEQVADVNASLGGDYELVMDALDMLTEYFEMEDVAGLSAFVEARISRHIDPFIIDLNERVNEYQLVSEGLFVESIEKNEQFLYGSAIVIVIGLTIAGILGYLIYSSIARPIRKIAATVNEVSAGDYYARTKVSGSDELGQLGEAFDGLLEDKVASLVQAEQENERLNSSIIALLKAVSRLSQRDLTIKVPVTEDVTGPVADALNQLTSETSQVLQGVRSVSEQVARASAMVKSQSDNVIDVAHHEQEEVEGTGEILEAAVGAMNNIAQLALECDVAAEGAIQATRSALQSVTDTVGGINGIRDTIHETEKRIKRLGDRSQDITRAVNLINTISERTHILALNASMHAASAGEAGRGFAVVADEVQRLAENARDATSQITTLVSNIQVETSDTVSTMNNLITEVVGGSQLAATAGEQMEKTRGSTENLVQAVRQIAERSRHQAQLNNDLQGRYERIRESSQLTTARLTEQTKQTSQLVEYARGLLQAVQVFKLPGARSDAVKPAATESAGAPVEQVQHKKAS